MKVGVMGGTFNPPHNGHLAAAAHVRMALELEKILFIPTNQPPHKQLPVGSATTAQRCEMVKRMTASYDWAIYCDLEVRRGGASYTIDTLRDLHKQGYHDLTLIVGTDMLLSFDKSWRAPDEIVRLAKLAVVARDGGDWQMITQQAKKLTAQFGAEIRLVKCPALTISSTDVRQSGDFEKLTPPAVAAYIRENRLYQQV